MLLWKKYKFSFVAACVQIMAMSTMKDSERLELLKEIGGTRVYEDKRKESKKVMEDAEAKKAEVRGSGGGGGDRAKVIVESLGKGNGRGGQKGTRV
jgi:hypothetical protein